MTLFFDFNAEDWARVQASFCAWWAGELPRSLVVVEALDRDLAPYWPDQLTRYPLDTPDETLLDDHQRLLAGVHLLGDAFPKWHPNFGPGVVAAFLGAPVEYGSATTWFAPLGVASLNEMQLRFDPANPWWRRIERLTQAACARWGGQAVIGHTDLGGNLDVLASLRGTQDLLMDLYDCPDEVERLTREITALWLEYYERLFAVVAPLGLGATGWGPFWSPGATYMLQSDFAYMISPQMFARFVLPDLEACCQRLDHAVYHMDGKGQIPHLDMLLSIERLRCIQWIPGDGAPPPEAWLPLLARIRQAGKLCQVYVTPQGAFQIARQLGPQGFLFCVSGKNDPNMTLAEAQAFLDAFETEFY